MKFGVILPHRWLYASGEEIANFAKEAESLGFHSVWVTDHVIIPKDRLERGHIFYESLVTLSFIGSIVKKACLGTCVLILPIRNPLLLAKEVATLDVLTGGRVILGVGVGWIKEELEAFGVKYDGRDKMAEESIEIMRGLWAEDERTSYEGSMAKFRNMLFFPKPFRKGGPPIWVGGNKKPSINIAAKVGDGWIPWAISVQNYGRGADLIKRAGVVDDFTFALATPVELRKGASSRYEGFFREIHTTIAGDLDEVTKTIDEYSRAGMRYLITSFRDVRLFRDVNTKEMRAQMNLFAKEIMPSFEIH